MTNPIDIVFPQDQQEGTEAVIARWLVAEGDSVSAHDPVVEIETDKVVVEIAAPEDGIISNIRLEADAAVNPGEVVCTLLSAAATNEMPVDHTPSDNSLPEGSLPQGGKTNNRQALSPAVKQRIQQHKLDISGLTGSGRNGRITLQDVETLIADLSSLPQLGATSPATSQVEKTGTVEDSTIIPHDNMRKRIATNMVDSMLHTAPHVTAVFEADLSAVVQHRKTNKPDFAASGLPLTFTSYFVSAAISALKKVPQVNSRWHDDHLEVFQHINMGIGTALGDKGLIVPVLHNAASLDLKGIAAGLSDLTGRAHEGKLTPADVRGGTFTISNHGVSGSLIATPIIINQPQSAILGIGKIEKRIKILEIDGEDVISIKPMCYISLTIDHRVLDGFQTNAFLSHMVGTLENWPD
jgi:2-oxoglutarate dehydrogenase E2 component (dihydrolipoamide succinyltransferase)